MTQRKNLSASLIFFTLLLFSATVSAGSLFTASIMHINNVMSPPLGFYYTGYTDGGYSTGHFFRSLSPVNETYADATMSENYNGTAFNLVLVQKTANGYDLGYYYPAGILGNLTTGAGLNITGTGFGVNVWLNPNSFTWSPISGGEQFTGLGANGGYGSGSTVGNVIINGSTTQSFTGACSGSLTLASIASGVACPGINANTPIAIWIGIGPLSVASTVTAAIIYPPTTTTITTTTLTTTIGAAPGATGATGAIGEKGATGAQGAIGAIGIQGIPGLPGLTGLTGLIGAAGSIGINGIVGAVGLIGISGLVGAQGAPANNDLLFAGFIITIILIAAVLGYYLEVRKRMNNPKGKKPSV